MDALGLDFGTETANKKINIDNIICLLDNDINKQGKRLYGTDLEVGPSTLLKDYISPIVILRAGAYDAEIKSDIIQNINSDVIFW